MKTNELIILPINNILIQLILLFVERETTIDLYLYNIFIIIIIHCIYLLHFRNIKLIIK